MSGLRSALLIARQDLVLMLWRREAVLWIFVMPIVFYYFMSLTMNGFGDPAGSTDAPEPLALRAPADSGFLIDELVTRLEAQNFRIDRPGTDEAWAAYARKLIVSVPSGGTAGADQSPTDWALAGNTVELRYESSVEGPNAIFDRLRVARAVFGVLGDAFVIELADETPSAAAFAELTAMPRNVGLSVHPAGLREGPPSGAAQAVPGTLVMFTMLILTTAGAIHLTIERNAGLFRRLAATPISRGQIILGKFVSRIGLATVQIAFAIVAGTVLFGMDWGPSVPMVLAVLFGWGAFNASLAMVLGNLARTEAQASGIGVLATLVLAALGGAWWPIEIAPAWMQRLALVLPTGWAMDAMHKLVNFAYPADVVIPHLAGLLGGALALGWLGARTFRYE